MFSNAIRHEGSAPVGDPIGKLNAIALNASQIEAALSVLASLPAEDAAKPLAQAAALQGYAHACTPGCDVLVAAALHARITALAKWTDASDPRRQSEPEAVLEAAARFPLSDLADGIGFETAGFQEMILFIEELPW